MKPIQKIEVIRAKNNHNWMRLLKIALEHAPKETEEVLKSILKQDLKIHKELRRLLKK